MKAVNFEKFMGQDPTVYESFVNFKEQKVLLCEHPTKGDEAPVIAVFPDLKLAFYTNFYDASDMVEGEYQVAVKNGGLVYQYEIE